MLLDDGVLHRNIAFKVKLIPCAINCRVTNNFFSDLCIKSIICPSWPLLAFKEAPIVKSNCVISPESIMACGYPVSDCCLTASCTTLSSLGPSITPRVLVRVSGLPTSLYGFTDSKIGPTFVWKQTVGFLFTVH